MSGRQGPQSPLPPTCRATREFSFRPRIINPVKIRKVVLFAADEEVRGAGAALRDRMPWIDIIAPTNPLAASSLTCNEACAFVLDDTAITLVQPEAIRKNNADAVIVLLSANPLVQCSPPPVALAKFPYTARADLVFATSRKEFAAARVIPAAVRAAEDRLNIQKYKRVRRFIFLIVDDEPRWFSQFLPVLYGIIGQRADVMVTRTYEETLSFLFGVDADTGIDVTRYLQQGHGDDVVCLITDIFFPKGSALNSDAGRDLIKLVRKYYPRYPIIVASKAKEALELGNDVLLMPKGDPGSLDRLRDYILNFTGLGDFLIRDASGAELHRVKTIHEMYRILEKAERDDAEGVALRALLEPYGENDHFSTWLYMHSYRELGDSLRPKRARGPSMVRVLKRHLKREILRMQYTPLMIDGTKVFNLGDLLNALRAADPATIQPLADNDIISSWLDRKGYPELAEELRPIHGSGARMVHEATQCVEKWMSIYEREGQSP
ncbi:MAG: hypothetical protein AB1486_30080 [Planctomycetota bacterium]